VALGGGTGLPAVLRGLRDLVQDGAISDLTAVVAMSDDGGSSGRLRKSRGLPPPGDIRNCLVALSAAEDLLSGLFLHRYGGEPELGGHNLGNLIVAALAEQTGSFMRAVEVSGQVLRIVGKILPVTLEDVKLVAELEDGDSLIGESLIGPCKRKIRSVSLQPSTARPTSGVVQAIMDADLVAIGPGSLYTSVIPNLVLEAVARAIRETSAVRVLVGNLVSCDESSGLGLADHVRIIEEHVGGPALDAVLVHDGPIDPAMLARYRQEGSAPLIFSGDRVAGCHVVRMNLAAQGPKLRHDSEATALGLLSAWEQVTSRAAAASERR
jgi:uncharacterized cofD-like protein